MGLVRDIDSSHREPKGSFDVTTVVVFLRHIWCCRSTVVINTGNKFAACVGGFVLQIEGARLSDGSSRKNNTYPMSGRSSIKRSMWKTEACISKTSGEFTSLEQRRRTAGEMPRCSKPDEVETSRRKGRRRSASSTGSGIVRRDFAFLVDGWKQ